MTNLPEALDLWLELTGVDPCARRFSMRDWDVRQMHEAIKEALVLDPTQITGLMLFESFATFYFKERSFSVEELLTGPTRTEDYLKKAAALLDILRTPDFHEVGQSFALAMRKAVRHYQADTPEVLKLIENRHELALLRRDALRSLENLKVDQFLAGEPEREGVAPRYNPEVYQFWNVNSLLACACSMPSGVSLCLIRDPDAYQSYFAFVIRNGGNLFLLSDVPQHSHPLQRYMSRRPDRELGRRIARNWFPYDLLGVKYDEEQERLYIDQKQIEGIVPFQQQAFLLKPIRELAAPEIVWTAMMLDLVVERFWNHRFSCPQLSYTAEMIRVENRLIEVAQRSHLPVPVYQGICVQTLSTAEVLAAAGDPALGSDGGRPNLWLEERYGAQVLPDSLNLLGCGAREHYITADAGEMISVSAAEDKKLPFWEKKEGDHRYSLHCLDATTYGSREQILADRLFIARYNLAKEIQRLADKEYRQRKEEIKYWYRKAVRKNIQALLSMAAEGEVWVALKEDFPGLRLQVPSRQEGDRWAYRLMQRLREEAIERPWEYRAGGIGSMLLSQGLNQRQKPTCFLTGAVASYRAVFLPQTAADLALLAGCRIDQLPDVLRHWAAETDHKGNRILDRIDPMAWALKNPWEKQNFNIVLHLAIRGVNRLQKEKRWPEGYEGCLISALRPEGNSRSTPSPNSRRRRVEK